MKRTIRLTESDLRRIVRESVNSMLQEVSSFTPNGKFDEPRHNIHLSAEYRRIVQNLTRTLEESLNDLSYIRNQRTTENPSEMEKIRQISSEVIMPALKKIALIESRAYDKY